MSISPCNEHVGQTISLTFSLEGGVGRFPSRPSATTSVAVELSLGPALESSSDVGMFGSEVGIVLLLSPLEPLAGWGRVEGKGAGSG